MSCLVLCLALCLALSLLLLLASFPRRNNTHFFFLFDFFNNFQIFELFCFVFLSFVLSFVEIYICESARTTSAIAAIVAVTQPLQRVTTSATDRLNFLLVLHLNEPPRHVDKKFLNAGVVLGTGFVNDCAHAVSIFLCLGELHLSLIFQIGFVTSCRAQRRGCQLIYSCSKESKRK